MREPTAVKAALKKVFSEHISDDPDRVDQILNRSVYSGKMDPGQWSPTAKVIVSTEHGIPSPVYTIWAVNSWYKVLDELNGMGISLFWEPINGGVVAFYDA